MTVPLATYRIQLREGMDFDAVAALASHLAALGVSHCYLSPITTAMQGSTHGYDVVDFGTIDPVLGGRDGFVAMARELKRYNLSILLDIVPNHMAASPMNRWWRDVLEWGQASADALHFDIDWSAPKLLLPVLGTHYADALAEGALTLSCDRAAGKLFMRYGALDLPLTPPSYSHVLGLVPGDHYSELALRFASCSPGGTQELTTALAEVLSGDETGFDDAVSAINADKDGLHHIHEQQVWRLAHWRLAREDLTYRRFFEISDLVGVRVEDPAVFDDVHACVVDLVRDGLVDGLRVDHIDGLADPLGYLRRLRAAVGEGTYIVVEKILGPGEVLRPSWPVAGTTGYEFISDLARLFVHPAADTLTRAYVTATGESGDVDAAVTEAKRRTFNRNLAGELDYLTHLAVELAQADVATRDLGSNTLRRAIVELASALPVYRTYVDAAGPAPEDQDLIARSVARARSSGEVEDELAFDLLTGLLLLTGATAERQAAALGFAARFQQTSGPLMAKSLEDTVFYRFNRLIALNEVGGEASLQGGSAGDVHASMMRRLERAPCSLSATTTHDTKRGEDARARLYAISEAPEHWSTSVGRWMRMNAALRSGTEGDPLPDANAEWLYYQALLGAWPAELRPDDPSSLSELADRMSAFMIKAAREAKRHTSWTRIDAGYEDALTTFATRSLDPGRSAVFLRDFAETARPFLVAGSITSLTQLAIKLLAPGVPDLYQGSELWDLSLVDPDNRRPVDYDARRAYFDPGRRSFGDLFSQWESGAVKLAALRAILGVRATFGEGIIDADYIPLHVEGPRSEYIFAFARRVGEKFVIIAGVRFAYRLFETAGRPTLTREIWDGTGIVCPPDLNATRLTSVFQGHDVTFAEGRIGLDQVLDNFPVAVLTN
ncbi:MAG TPA: malto-oligosyltrehalose synthase [Hyphomicrobium sp.]|nr:malto-oligosyltrehalose synthase [Hyphomicrobium sp.]